MVSRWRHVIREHEPAHRSTHSKLNFNVISLAEWKARHRPKDQPVGWTYYEVERDPSGRPVLIEVERKSRLDRELT